MDPFVSPVSRPGSVVDEYMSGSSRSPEGLGGPSDSYSSLSDPPSMTFFLCPSTSFSSFDPATYLFRVDGGVGFVLQGVIKGTYSNDRTTIINKNFQLSRESLGEDKIVH